MKLTRTHKKGMIALVCVIIALGVLTYLRVGERSPYSGLQNDLKSIVPPEALPYTDLEGNPVFLDAYKGKPLIINSWASWMPFSKDELVLLNELQTQKGDELTILAINRMENVERVKSYLSTFGIESHVLFLLDQSDNFYKASGGYAMPETIFYRKDGMILFHKRGTLTPEELVQYGDDILK